MTNEYTPTRAELRNDYINKRIGLTRWDGKAELIGAEFDRFIREIERKAQKHSEKNRRCQCDVLPAESHAPAEGPTADEAQVRRIARQLARATALTSTDVQQLVEAAQTMAKAGIPEPDEFEFMVRTHFTKAGRTWETQWMGEETARAILNWDEEGLTRTLFRRRKAGQPQPVEAVER